MKRSLAVTFCCYCWSFKTSSSFFVARPMVSRVRPHRPNSFLSAYNGNLVSMLEDRLPRRSLKNGLPTRAQRHSSTLMEAAKAKNEWLARFMCAIAATSVLVGAFAAAPLEAFAQSKADQQQPLVEALVQLPEEQRDWTKMLSDAGQAQGANMVITASLEGSDKPALGATIAMDRLKFPVMLQLFPANVVGGAAWPSDFQAKGTYGVKVAVCGGGEARGVQCKAPPLVGSGESIFVSSLEDVPEIAETGGMRVAATVVLSPASSVVKVGIE